MQLAWLTIPVLTLLFSGGAFGVGYLMRGTDVIMNQIALIAPNGSGSAAVTVTWACSHRRSAVCLNMKTYKAAQRDRRL